MESLEGYSYYDTPRGPQYIRNGAHDAPSDERRRGAVKYHPYSQAKRGDRSIPTTPTEAHLAETVNPHALLADSGEKSFPVSSDGFFAGSGLTSMHMDDHRSSTIEMDPQFYVHAAEGAHDRDQPLLPSISNVSQSDVRHSVDGSVSATTMATDNANHKLTAVTNTEIPWLPMQDFAYEQASNYTMSDGFYDENRLWSRAVTNMGSTSFNIYDGPTQKRMSTTPPEDTVFENDISSHAIQNDIMEDKSPVLAHNQAMNLLPVSNSGTARTYLTHYGTAGMTGMENIINETLFEYGPFYDYPALSTSKVPEVQPDIIGQRPNSLPLDISAGQQPEPNGPDTPVPQVGIVGGYFPPEDESAHYNNTPLVNSQGNIRIARLPVKKVAVVYDVPAIDDMTVSQLKTELKKRNLSAIGKKSELQSRLQSFTSDATFTS